MKTSVIDVRDMLSVLSVLGVEQRVSARTRTGIARLERTDL